MGNIANHNQKENENEEDEIPFNYEAHVKYFLAVFKKITKIEGNQVHQMTSYLFIVNSLTILNQLPEEVKNYVTEFVLRNAVIENKKIIGFRGGSFCGFTKEGKAAKTPKSRKNSFKFEEKEEEEICEKIDLVSLEAYDSHNNADIPHIASTYSALSILCLFNYLNKKMIKSLITKYLNSNEVEFSPEAIEEHISKSRRNSGNINCQNWDCENDARFFYCACAIKKYLEIYNADDKEKINFTTIDDHNFFLNDSLTKTYFKSIRNYEGGYSMEKGGESQAGLTYCAIASLKLLGMGIPEKEKLIFWLLNRTVEQGVNGRTGKTPDSCYSFWSYASLCLIDKQELANQRHIRKFVLNCQCSVGGFSKYLNIEGDEKPDLLHSFYSLACLSLLKCEKLMKFDPVLAVAYE